MLDERIDMTVGENTSLGVRIAYSFIATDAAVIVDGDFGPVVLHMSREGLTQLLEKLLELADGMAHYYDRPLYRIAQDQWAIPQRDGSFVPYNLLAKQAALAKLATLPQCCEKHQQMGNGTPDPTKGNL